MKLSLGFFAFFLILLSLLVGVYSFFFFSPWSFFIQLSIGSGLGFLGFLLLIVALAREIRRKDIL